MKYKKSALGTWELGLDQTSASSDEVVGSLREDLYGNKYHLAKNGSTALAPSKATVAVAVSSDVTNKAATAADIGDTNLTLTIASSTYSENYFKGGTFQINDATGEGYRYPISYSSAVSSGTSISISLEFGLKVALTTSSEFTLVHNPFMEVVISATVTDRPTGVPIVAVPANHYFWSQTSGEGMYLAADSAAVGTTLMLGTTDGSLIAQTIDSTATAAVNVTSAPIAIVTGTAAVATEYKPCIYQID